MRIQTVTLLAFLGCASCGSRVNVIPTPNAPHLPPSANVSVLRGPAPNGLHELARIEIHGSTDYRGSFDEQAEACRGEMAREARRLGADLVVVVEEGRHYFHNGVAYCNGFAYTESGSLELARCNEPSLPMCVRQQPDRSLV
jgi:hypothetical protein